MPAQPRHIAVFCTAAVLAWQGVVAAGYFHGNWNGFFYAGDAFRQAPAVQAEHSFVFAGSGGYDGQFYHAAAHDPLDRDGTARDMDTPALRFSRILLPGLSYLLGAARLFWVDRVYRGLELVFLFLGVASMGAYLTRYGRSAWWGATFLLIPAVPMSVERQLPDLPLCALIVAALLAFETGHRKLCWLALAAACLDRDTAVVALAGLVATSLWTGRPREAALWITAYLPQGLWALYLRIHLGSAYWMPSWRYPFGSVIFALRHPQTYALNSGLASAVHVLDLVSIAAAVLAFVLGPWVWLGAKTALNWMALAYAVFGVIISASAGMEYRDVYGFGRVLSPLFLLLWMESIRRYEFKPATPLLLIVPRAALPIGLMTFLAMRNLL